MNYLISDVVIFVFSNLNFHSNFLSEVLLVQLLSNTIIIDYINEINLKHVGAFEQGRQVYINCFINFVTNHL